MFLIISFDIYRRQLSAFSRPISFIFYVLHAPNPSCGYTVCMD
uniref:Uncharacterized protein n=1 Tax=Myoviridae sp. ctplG2 TaxID=2826700 RepID=A0A8S5LVZ7_9CAUD|nr:MAG TPA: hypothetical protein [Myoviridae sp. ctplG2]DAO68410.1 MAG TPA: hypothetical protein [Caudoviricetes sp.]DAT31395.1 MAG TPA: hypothetical protein [Caudoviricetes sp.]